MKAIEKYLTKKGLSLKTKAKQKKSDITTSEKQKDLLVLIATDLGYL